MDRENIMNWKNKIIDSIKEGDLLNPGAEPEIIIDQQFNDFGFLHVRAVLSDVMASMIRKETAGKIGTDVFLMNCIGKFQMHPKAFDIGCSVINDDGIPVTVVGKDKFPVVAKKIDFARMKIIDAFSMV